MVLYKIELLPLANSVRHDIRIIRFNQMLVKSYIDDPISPSKH